jgi:hypothetical protein
MPLPPRDEKLYAEEAPLKHFRNSDQDSKRANVSKQPVKSLHATNLTPTLLVVSFNDSVHALLPAPAKVT